MILENNKFCKLGIFINTSSFRTVSMLPGDRNGLPDVFCSLRILGNFENDTRN